MTNQLMSAIAKTKESYINAINSSVNSDETNRAVWDNALLDQAIDAVKKCEFGNGSAASVRYLVRVIGDSFYDKPNYELVEEYGVSQDNLRMLEDIEMNL